MWDGLAAGVFLGRMYVQHEDCFLIHSRKWMARIDTYKSFKDTTTICHKQYLDFTSSSSISTCFEVLDTTGGEHNYALTASNPAPTVHHDTYSTP